MNKTFSKVIYKGRHPYPLCHAYRQMDDKLFTHPPSLLIGLFRDVTKLL